MPFLSHFCLLVLPLFFESIGSVSTDHEKKVFVPERLNRGQSPGRRAAGGRRETLPMPWESWRPEHSSGWRLEEESVVGRQRERP